MPRDTAGNYTLPAGNPVASGEIISASWANSTMNDLGQSLSASLDRYGRGGMLAPFQFTDGTESAPGATWSNEPTTGLYRAAYGDLRFTLTGTDVQRWTSANSYLWRNSQWEEILTQTGGGGDTTINNLVVTGSFTSPGIDDNATSTTLTLNSDSTANFASYVGATRLILPGDLPVIACDSDKVIQVTGGGLSVQGAFTSPGIDDNATSTAITIDANENVGIGTTNPSTSLDIIRNGVQPLRIESTSGNRVSIRLANTGGDAFVEGIGNNIVIPSGNVLVGTDTSEYSANNRKVLQLLGGSGGSILALKSPTADFYIQALGTSADADVVNRGNGGIKFYTNNTEKMRIDASGRVGIGTDTPAHALDVEVVDGGVQLKIGRTNTTVGSTWMGADANGFHLGVGAYGSGNSVADPNGFTVDASGNFGIGTNAPASPLVVSNNNVESLEFNSTGGVSGGPYIQAFNRTSAVYEPLTCFASTHTWYSGSSRSMDLDSSGNLLVGKSVSGGLTTNGFEVNSAGVMYVSYSGTQPCAHFNRGSNGSGLIFQVGKQDAGGVTFTQNGTPAFFSASDERLKDNITDHESELANVMALRPTRWDWKDSTNTGEGFIAQELEQTAWSDLVSEGDDGFKQVSGLGAVETRLIKAIQEQQAMIETLQAEVAALKA